MITREQYNNDVKRFNLGHPASAVFWSRNLCYLVNLDMSRKQSSWQEIHRWCREKIGIDNYSWAGDVFAFRDQEDAVIFKLRWL